MIADKEGCKKEVYISWGKIKGDKLRYEGE